VAGPIADSAKSGSASKEHQDEAKTNQAILCFAGLRLAQCELGYCGEFGWLGFAHLWSSFLAWVRDNQAGDVASIAGVGISVVGFVATLIGVARSKNAARRAEEAARDARNSIRTFDAIVDMSATIAALEEIRRLQRQSAWSLLPDRYAAARKLLIAFRQSIADLMDDQRSAIQTAIVNFREIESQLDRSQGAPALKLVVRINRIVSEQIDTLLAILNDISATR
jgi:ribosomal protein S13